MTKKEFMKLKVGDKVQFFRDRTIKSSWSQGLDGKIFTVRCFNGELVCVFETPFCFSYECIEAACKKIIITEHVIDGKKTIVKLSNGNVGIAKCSPDDEFDEYEGLRIATARAYGIEPFPKADEKKNPKNEPFNVGERVQFKTWSEMEKEFGFDGIGNINCKYMKYMFVQSMKHLCGTYATIKEIDGKRVYLKNFSSKGSNHWNFSTDMIKHIDRTKKSVKNTHRAEVEE